MKKRAKLLKGAILDSFNENKNYADKIIFDESNLRQILIEKIEDMIALDRQSYLDKYRISLRTYYYWKKNFVLYYNIDPRVLYGDVYIEEFKPYMDDKKFKLPIEEQLIIPSSVVTNPEYYTKKKTVQIDRNGNITQVWLKQDLKEKDYVDHILKTIKDICNDKLKPIPIIQPPKISNKELLTFYPLPDLHFGLLIDENESVQNISYNLDKSKEWLEKSINYLVDHAPDSEAACITDLGDCLHSPDDGNRTPAHGNVLDVDQKHSKIVKIFFESMRLLIEKSLKKHKIVYFFSVSGNHNEYINIYLKEFISAWFKDNPRLIIEKSNRPQQYLRFGKNILGFAHGHQLKPEKCSEIMLYDNQDYLSQSKFRYFHFGHYHNDKSFRTPMVKVEIHRTMIPLDHYAGSYGFRGEYGQSKAIVYHKDFGEISRINFSLPILDKN